MGYVTYCPFLMNGIIVKNRGGVYECLGDDCELWIIQNGYKTKGRCALYWLGFAARDSVCDTSGEE